MWYLCIKRCIISLALLLSCSYLLIINKTHCRLWLKHEQTQRKSMCIHTVFFKALWIFMYHLLKFKNMFIFCLNRFVWIFPPPPDDDNWGRASKSSGEAGRDCSRSTGHSAGGESSRSVIGSKGICCCFERTVFLSAFLDCSKQLMQDFEENTSTNV